jgi:hypothetical protein
MTDIVAAAADMIDCTGSFDDYSAAVERMADIADAYADRIIAEGAADDFRAAWAEYEATGAATDAEMAAHHFVADSIAAYRP